MRKWRATFEFPKAAMRYQFYLARWYKQMGEEGMPRGWVRRWVRNLNFRTWEDNRFIHRREYGTPKELKDKEKQVSLDEAICRTVEN